MPWLEQLQSHITLEQMYLALSLLVAVVIWLEGQALKATQGKLPDSAWFHWGSLIDTLWFFVSLAVLYFLNLPSIAIAVPVAYGIYTLFGWVYGTRLIHKDGIPDSPEDLVIPMPYVSYSQAFAVTVRTLCAFVLAYTLLNI